MPLTVYQTNIKSLEWGWPAMRLSYQKPHNQVSKDTVSRWIKIFLKQSGISSYGAHSTRSTSTMGHTVLAVLLLQLQAPHQIFTSRLSWMLLDEPGKANSGKVMINQLTQRVKTLESNFYCIVMKSNKLTFLVVGIIFGCSLPHCFITWLRAT